LTRRELERYALPLTSLFVAILLWFYVVGQKEKEWTFSVPVSVKVSSNEVSGWATPDKVSVLLKGPQRIVDRVASDQMLVRMVLAENQAGTYTRAILPSMVDGIPDGLEVLRIEPAEVRVDIRPLEEIRYRIVPQIRSSDTAFVLGGVIEVEPRYAELRGTSNVLRDVTEVRTEVLEVGGPAGRHKAVLRLLEPDGAKVFPVSASVVYDVVVRGESSPGMIPSSPILEGAGAIGAEVGR
jgi:YbbR domain-containing protein